MQHHALQETADALFYFKVSFLTDDKTECLCPVMINLTTLLENKRLLQEWDHLFLDREPTYPGVPPFSLPPLEKPYEKAREVLKERIVPKIAEIQKIQKKTAREGFVED